MLIVFINVLRSSGREGSSGSGSGKEGKKIAGSEVGRFGVLKEVVRGSFALGGMKMDDGLG